ncbi:hypothetical protein L9F63_025370, partial [Diploptera punctata]
DLQHGVELYFITCLLYQYLSVDGHLLRTKLPRILSDKTTSVIFVCYRGTHLRLRPTNNTLNSLVDSIKFLFSTYTENMIEVFKTAEQYLISIFL